MVTAWQTPNLSFWPIFILIFFLPDLHTPLQPAVRWAYLLRGKRRFFPRCLLAFLLGLQALYLSGPIALL
jgi:hypothetical protein